MAGEPSSLESTAELLSRVRKADPQAERDLLTRFIPLLQRWAHGRLPSTARDLAETDDIVQVAVIRALRRIPHFESRREGAFLAYLRQIVWNAIREEYRRGAARERNEDKLTKMSAAPEPGGTDREGTVAAYEAALERLPERQREAVMLRLEFDYSYAQIAAAIECATEDAARMTVKRALLRLTREMKGADRSAD